MRGFFILYKVKPVVYGCTDSTALNYDSTANIDDGSCIVIIIGCTDVAAYNYDPTANVLDSTACLYEAGGVGEPGVPYWLNDPCYAWVIDVDAYCCEVEWDTICQETYNYCESGWPGGIENFENSRMLPEADIVIYPNPTNGTLNINSNKEIDVIIFDMLGNRIIDIQQVQKEIDISNLPNGIYNMSILYDNKRFNKRIIKQ